LDCPTSKSGWHSAARLREQIGTDVEEAWVDYNIPQRRRDISRQVPKRVDEVTWEYVDAGDMSLAEIDAARLAEARDTWRMRGFDQYGKKYPN